MLKPQPWMMWLTRTYVQNYVYVPFWNWNGFHLVHQTAHHATIEARKCCTATYNEEEVQISPSPPHLVKVGYLEDSSIASSPISSTEASPANDSTTSRESDAHSMWCFSRKARALFLSCVLSAAFQGRWSRDPHAVPGTQVR